MIACSESIRRADPMKAKHRDPRPRLVRAMLVGMLAAIALSVPPRPSAWNGRARRAM